MKPYVVVRWKQIEVFQVAYGTRPRDAVGYVWVTNQEEANVDKTMFNNDVYFCDTLQDANALVAQLIAAWPQHHFIVAQSQTVTQAKPIEFVSAKITDKGVLPF